MDHDQHSHSTRGADVHEVLQTIPPDQQIYLLIDNSAFDGAWLPTLPEAAIPHFGPTLRAIQASGLKWQALLGDAEQPHQSAAVPLLVQLSHDVASRHLVQDLVRQGAQFGALHWLFSPQPLAEITARLQQRLRIQLTGKEFVLRYYDSRLFQELLPILTDEQQQQLLCVATQWHYLDRDGNLNTLTCGFQNYDLHTFPWMPSTEQAAQLAEVGKVDRVHIAIEALLREALMPRALPSERHTWIKMQIEAAQRYAITDVNELALYCGAALTEGEAFHLQPAWQARLAQVKTGNATLAELEYV